MAFTTYNPSTNTTAELVNSFYAAYSGVTVSSITVGYVVPNLQDAPTSIAFYDGSIPGLGIGAGLMLTTGDPQPALENTTSGWGASGDFTEETDTLLENTVRAVFPDYNGIYDLTYLEFHVNVSNLDVAGLRFNVLFASEEYPEYVDDFVDIAGVYVNGTNYALFNGNAQTPLSVLDQNLAANFRDNDPWDAEGDVGLGIEYDGVSVALQIAAPLVQGTNVIRIAIADTGDSILDSALLISGMQPVNYAGYGLAQQVSLGTGAVVDSPSNQSYVGTTGNNVVQFTSTGGGDDVFNGGGGLDEAIFQMGLGGITGYSWNGSVLTLESGTNSTTLVDVERVLLGDGTFAALDTGTSGTTFGVYAMLWAGFNANPDTNTLSSWVAHADNLGGDLGAVGDLMIDTYAPGLGADAVISYLYRNIMGSNPDASTLSSLTGMIQGETSLGDLFATGSLLSLNTSEIAHVIGSIQMLNHAYF